MTSFLFICGILVTFRLSLLVSKEDGPMWLLLKLRRLPPPRSSAREGLSCPWCVSLWAGSLVSLMFYWMDFIPGMLAPFYALALSAGAICLNQQFTRE